MGKQRGLAAIGVVVVAVAAVVGAVVVGVVALRGEDEPKRDEQKSAAAGVEHITIPVGDMTFDALAAGPEDGEPVILLHGFPQTSESWRAQIEALADAGYRAIAPDQRGYSPGARPQQVADYGIVELADDVTGMADALGIDRFHLVGHDWGGGVAWTYATLHPDRLLSLEVLATPHPRAFAAELGEARSDQASRSSYMDLFRQPGYEDELLANDGELLHNMMVAGSGMPQASYDTYVKTLGTPEALGAALNWYRAMDLGPVDALPPITTPTLYVFATDDIAFSRKTADATEQFVEGPYQYEVLDGVSHWISEEAPDQVSDLLLTHVAKYGDDASSR